jgi:aspartate kinase
LNTNNSDFPGTTIVKKRTGNQIITAISSKKNVPLVNIYSTEMLLSKGFLKKVFTIFTKHNISIDLVSVSEVSISLTLDNDDQLKKAVLELQKISQINIIKNVSIISLIGDKISKDPEILSLIFSTLYKKEISVKMISFGATNTNISLVVDMDKETEVVKTLHNKVLLRKF